MSSGSTDDVIEKLPSLAAITVPRTLFPFRSSTLLPASAVPSIVGVLILVKAISVVINGAAGAVVSIVIGSPVDGTEVFPASSVAVTVSV